MKQAINLVFTKKGQKAISLYTNEELLEIFSRYINTLNRHSQFTFYVPVELNAAIVTDGEMIIFSDQKSDFVKDKERNTYYTDLAKCLKNPFRKRFTETVLDSIFVTKDVQIT